MKHVVRTHRPENRLAKAISVPGGLTIGDALERAAENIAVVREDCMIALDAKIAEIDAATSGANFTCAPDDVQRVYSLANQILNEAGVYDLHELSEAGRSLCDLTANAAVIDLEPIRVHVAAMKSLRRPEVESDANIRAAVLQGLRQVTAKMRAKAAANA